MKTKSPQLVWSGVLAFLFGLSLTFTQAGTYHFESIPEKDSNGYIIIDIGETTYFSVDPQPTNGTVDSTEWTFENGSPATSTDKALFVSYDNAQPGVENKVTCQITRTGDDPRYDTCENPAANVAKVVVPKIEFISLNISGDTLPCDTSSGIALLGKSNWEGVVKVTPTSLAAGGVELRFNQSGNGYHELLYKDSTVSPPYSKLGIFTGGQDIHDGAGFSTSTTSTNGVFNIKGNDSPRFGDVDPNNTNDYKAVNVNVSFKLYLQYRISPNDWKTVGLGAWSWTGSCHNNGGLWTGTSTTSSASGSASSAIPVEPPPFFNSLPIEEK